MSILSASSLRFSGLPFRCDSRMLRSLPKSCGTASLGSEVDREPSDATTDSHVHEWGLHQLRCQAQNQLSHALAPGTV
jgi:hypothetical protein